MTKIRKLLQLTPGWRRTIWRAMTNLHTAFSPRRRAHAASVRDYL